MWKVGGEILHLSSFPLVPYTHLLVIGFSRVVDSIDFFFSVRLSVKILIRMKISGHSHSSVYSVHFWYFYDLYVAMFKRSCSTFIILFELSNIFVINSTQAFLSFNLPAKELSWEHLEIYLIIFLFSCGSGWV